MGDEYILHGNAHPVTERYNLCGMVTKKAESNSPLSITLLFSLHCSAVQLIII